MRLVGAQIIPFSAPLRPPLNTSQGRVATREGFILKLVGDCGKVGLGEASPACWIDGRPLAETRAALEAIVMRLEGCRDAAVLRSAVLGEGAAGCLTPAAACALDTALLDLEARSRDVGVAAILGAASQAPVPVSTLLTSQTPENVAREALVALERGYTVFKLKVGAGALEDDLANLNALRGATGASSFIRLDANRAWSFGQAVSALNAFGPEKIEFVEEPLGSCSPAELARLRDAAGIALALDESVGSVTGLEAFCAERGPAPVIVLKAARLGGPSRCLEIARAARAAGVAKIVVTDSIESSVGMSAAIHLATAVAAARPAAGLGGASFGFALTGGFGEGGSAHDAPWVAPCGPGLNVSLRHSES